MYLFIGLVFVLVGGGGLGLYHLQHKKVLRQIAAARQWPEAMALIEVADCKKFSGRHHYWRPILRYRFDLSGQTFTGNRLMFGRIAEGDYTEKQARALLEPYRRGGRTPVRYDPSNPRESVLELRHTKQPLAGRIAFAGFVAFGLVLLVMHGAGFRETMSGAAISRS